MLVIPAIDLKDGQAVRLYKGDYNQKTVYSNNPEELAKEFETMGAKWLHVVDLDGAKDGTLQGPNFKMYEQIASVSKINFVVSGGIKDKQNILDVAKKDYYACIVGKAYYEGKVDLKEVIACLQNG